MSTRPLNTRNEQHIEHIYGGGTTKVGDKKTLIQVTSWVLLANISMLCNRRKRCTHPLEPASQGSMDSRNGYIGRESTPSKVLIHVVFPFRTLD
jgi:hypothetical protein